MISKIGLFLPACKTVIESAASCALALLDISIDFFPTSNVHLVSSAKIRIYASSTRSSKMAECCFMSKIRGINCPE